MSPTSAFQRGSEWRRWDPHLHAPGTLLSDQFSGTWDAYLQSIATLPPTVGALGITDYFCIGTYRRVRASKRAGQLQNIPLIFPNVELRLDIKTSKSHAVNLHLLFSPEDPDHETQIERILGHLTWEFKDRVYSCTVNDLRALGRLVDGKQKDDDAALSAGANQFKVTLQGVRDLFRKEEWMRGNCLVAVSGGTNDGTSGLQGDDSFKLVRREIETFADIIFSATPNQRAFWLGQTANHDRAFIESNYGSLKPCLHGSDAHREGKVGAPDLDRYCWIKGDPTFESLRQAVLEPEARVWIGAQPPADALPELAIESVAFGNASWLADKQVDLNPGLVAVIGARGSGKTALIEMIAKAGGAAQVGVGESSFLRRAQRPVDLLRKATVALSWRDGPRAPMGLTSTALEEGAESEVCYLSQQFVDKLCSSNGLARELRREMERVIFDSTDPTDRLDTGSFDELADTYLAPIRRRRHELTEEIAQISAAIVLADQEHSRLPSLKKQKEELEKKVGQTTVDLKALLPKGMAAKVTRLKAIEAAYVAAEAKIESLKRQRTALQGLAAEVKHVRTTREPRRFADMKQAHASAGLSPKEWENFAMQFAGAVDVLIAKRESAVAAAITVATDGKPGIKIDPAAAPAAWPFTALKVQLEAAKKAVGIVTEQQKKYDALQKSLKVMETQIRKIDEASKAAATSQERMKALVIQRRERYSHIFSNLEEEAAALRQLYEPLSDRLQGATGALSRLKFFVFRRVDLDSWVDAAEREVLDLRRGTRFRGHGALKDAASKLLLPALATGKADEVATAMDTFRTEYAKDLQAAMPASVATDGKGKWMQDMASWLYATDHVSVEYGIAYDGTMIEQLSPGTRGIVLLLVYLALDQRDVRPLIVDQPEENLDPQSVFDELVPHFREARKRRQIIVVTHNANLVVNTDVDQVIVASMARGAGQGLPTMSYACGSIENPKIRTAVCEILEGGERAFLERERRYRLRQNRSS